MKRKIGILIFLCIAAFSVTGCGEIINLTDEEQEIIATYAAHALLNYDKGYNAKYEVDILVKAKAEAAERIKNSPKTPEPVETGTDQPANTSSPTDTPAPTPSQQPAAPSAETPAPAVQTQEPVQASQNTPTQKRMAPYEIGKLFGIEGIEVNYIGFEALDTYPTVSDGQLAFTMDASQGSKLIVAKFELRNGTSAEKACNIVGQNIKFQMRFNGSDYVAVQKTLLTDDFSTLNCILQPKETRQVVIISQVDTGYETSISNVDLITRIGGENSLIQLQ